MKRNKYGINFDLGVPLTEEDFQYLYIELNPEKKRRLTDWIKNKNETPIIVSGQIGTGKTTLINKAFHESKMKVDLKISLDIDIPTDTPGACWGVFLGNVLELAHNKKIDISSFQLSEDLIDVKYKDDGITKLVELLCTKARSFSDYDRQKRLYDRLEPGIELLKNQLREIIDLIQDKIKRKLFIFAEGVDKFGIFTAKYHALQDVLDFMSQYKTLYEANFVHYFSSGNDWQRKSKNIVVTAETPGKIEKILLKRLGAYVEYADDMLPLLVKLSGGNLRQALRLLLEYDYASRELEHEKKEAVDYACRRVREDLLNTMTGGIDAGLLKVIKKDGYITYGTLTDFQSREAAQEAAYMNWILIRHEADAEQKWPAGINPLLQPAVEAFKEIPDSPETRMLRKWAEANEVSPFGLEIDSSISPETLQDIINSTGSAYPSLKITDVFYNLAAYFLTPERNDKIIIAYENKETVQLAGHFIFGKAGTFAPGHFKEINVSLNAPDGDKEHSIELEFNRLEKDSYDGYSIFFYRELTLPELVLLERSRDAFLDYKMLWWIEYAQLKKYLKHWPQLRQFFKIYRLEEDILANITAEEIQDDLDELEYADYPADDLENIKKKLEFVLNYLKGKTDER